MTPAERERLIALADAVLRNDNAPYGGPDETDLRMQHAACAAPTLARALKDILSAPVEVSPPTIREPLDGGPLTPVEIAAQCWCDPRTSHLEMDTVLATVFAERLAAEVLRSHQPVVTPTREELGDFIEQQFFIHDDSGCDPYVLADDILALIEKRRAT